MIFRNFDSAWPVDFQERAVDFQLQEDKLSVFIHIGLIFFLSYQNSNPTCIKNDL